MNIDRLISMSEKLIELQLLKNMPNEDSEPLKKLLRFLNAFYKDFPPEKIDGNFKLFYCATKNEIEGLRKSQALNQTNGSLHEVIKFPSVILIYEDNDYEVWNETNLNKEDINGSYILGYELDEYESFFVNNTMIRAEKSVANSRSIFSHPTYWDLEQAIKSYYFQKAKKCFCKFMEVAWKDEKRLIWNSGPEHLLRDSLYDYLRTVLRGAEVKREQNVNETNPVDIKVSWYLSRARGLIDIKWLGISVNETGKVTQRFSKARAQAGAIQLRNYIDISREENHDYHFVGYLVVFDGRRKNALKNNNDLSDAFYYKEKDLEYSPNLLERKDLNLKSRLFIEPCIAG